MSLIGKRVRTSEYVFGSHSTIIHIDGIVIDKIQSTIIKKNDMPSGHGGSISLEQYFVVDYYLIKTAKGIEKTLCSNLVEIFE